MDQEESDHPNVLTEEVTSDRRILDDEVNHFTVDLTPCSEHNTQQSMLDNNNTHRNIKTRSFG